MDKYTLQLTLFNKSILSGMQTFSRLIHLCHYVTMTEILPGEIVEFGSYRGDTAKLITSLTNKRVHVYDSFEGLPDNDITYKGDMNVSVRELVENFKEDKIKLPTINKKFFNELTKNEIPSKISFAHIDGDLYKSIYDSLNLVYDNMVKSGIIMIDDYDSEKWNGVTLAVKDFMKDKKEPVIPLYDSFGYSCNKCIIKF